METPAHDRRSAAKDALDRATQALDAARGPVDTFQLLVPPASPELAALEEAHERAWADFYKVIDETEEDFYQEDLALLEERIASDFQAKK